MSHRETVTDNRGLPIAVRDVSERDNGDVHITTYKAEVGLVGNTSVTEKVSDITIKPDGTVYEHHGSWPFDSTIEIRSPK